MKLASLKSGRDGRLVVVSDDLAWCADAGHIAPTLQAALDGWDWIAPALRNLATDLAHDMIPKERFHERAAASPLPRAYLLLQAVGQVPCEQARSDRFSGPRDAIQADGDSISLTTGVTLVTGDVPRGTGAEAAAALIRLVGLTRCIVAAAGEADCAFSPVFVTPDSLGECWTDRLVGPVCVDINGAAISRDDAGKGLHSSFADRVAETAKVGTLRAGTMISFVQPSVPLKKGDTVRVWMDDEKRHSVFGAIEQQMG